MSTVIKPAAQTGAHTGRSGYATAPIPRRTEVHGITAESPTAAQTGREDGAYLEVRHLSKYFGSFCALEDVSLKIGHGEFVVILGPSGCGKTTLLRVIAGLEEQNCGQVLLAGEDISALPTAKRNCGIVFQSYALFPNLTAAQNISYGIHTKGMTRAQVAGRVDELLDLVGLHDFTRKYPAQMSGGQQQRVALARALASQPRLLLLDEPLSALDARVRVRLRGEIRELQQRLGITTVMVTHDQEEALTMAGRVVVMNDARLRQYDRPQEIYHNPRDIFVAGFIGAMNFLDGWRVSEHGKAARGSLSLAFAGGLQHFPKDETLTLSFRPEDVQIVPPGGEMFNVLSAVVTGIEFRGAVYRRALRIDGGSGGQPPLEIITDMQAQRLERLGVQMNKGLIVHIPPERVMAFRGGAKTEAGSC